MSKIDRRYLIVGLGRFGRSVAKSLSELGAEVIAADRNPKLVADAKNFTMMSVELDATNVDALRTLDLPACDAVCICIANEQTSIMASLLCVELGAREVIAKAQSDLQAEVLYKVGVTQVVFPERDAGWGLANKLVSSDILQSIALSKDYSTAEFLAASDWVGRTLMELEFRGKYGLSVIGIRHGDEEELNINPLPDEPIGIDDRIYVVGSIDNIRKVEKLLRNRSKR